MKKLSNIRKKQIVCASSSSSSSRSDEMMPGKENCDPKKRLVFGENPKSALPAGNRNPKAKYVRRKGTSPQIVTTASRKRRSYIVYDGSSDEDIQPTSKKVASLRRGLKISSAAAKMFEDELPWQLKVPITESTAFSKSNRKQSKGKVAAMCEDEQNLAIKEIKLHLKVHDLKFAEIKEMLQHIVARQLVRERVHDHHRPTSRPSDCQVLSHKNFYGYEPAPRVSSDCQILSQSVWSPPEKKTPPNAKNPRKTPGSFGGKKLAGTRSPRVHNIDPHQLVDAANFMNWRRMAAASDGPVVLRLSSEVVRTGNYDWFTELYDDGIKLRDEHMDVLINLLVVKFEEEMGASARDFSILDTLAWGGLTQHIFKSCDDDMMSYVRGSYPLNRGRAWHTVEKLYGFGHVSEDHWVGFQISFQEQRITVMDSMFLGRKRLGGYFEHMSRNLPLLCEKIDLWEKKGYSEPLHTPWEVVYAAYCPRQEAGDIINCGIFVMKALEAMARGKSFDSIQPDHCAVYRLSYYVDLHAQSRLIAGDD